jgi:uncharacterized protein (TIGR03382 family)
MTDLKRQFGAKGPSCGAEATDVAGDAPVKKGGGCCDAGASGPLGALWSLVVLAGLAGLLRRRRSSAR